MRHNYPGASGYARGTLDGIAITLDCALDSSRLRRRLRASSVTHTALVIARVCISAKVAQW